MWHTLFCCVWSCKRKFSILRHLIFEVLPHVLPCEQCRKHFTANKRRVDRRKRHGTVIGEPTTTEELFFWLWAFKDEVNKTLGKTSITFDELTERYVYSGAVIDEVLLADMLIVLAFEAEESCNTAKFSELCVCLSKILPLPSDSEFLKILQTIDCQNVTIWAVRAARSARIERGYPVLQLSHYKTLNTH